MKKKIFIALAAVLVIIIIVAVFITAFDNTTKNVVKNDSVNVVLTVNESSIYDGDNKIELTLTVENNNSFDINMFESRYQDNDLNFEVPCEGVYTISANDTLSMELEAEFGENISSADYMSVLKSKKILIAFNAAAANQNDSITRIQPVIE